MAKIDETLPPIEMQSIGNDEVEVTKSYEHQDRETLTRTGKRAVLKVRHPYHVVIKLTPYDF